MFNETERFYFGPLAISTVSGKMTIICERYVHVACTLAEMS